MPKFQYTARGLGQEAVTGVLEAENEESALSQLEKKGLFPMRLCAENREAARGRHPEQLKIKKSQIAQFIQQLYDMLSSGVTLLRSLQIVESQTSNPSFKNVLKTLMESVKGGMRFSDALKQFPSLFSTFVVNLIRSGEAGGALDSVLMRLSEFSQAQEETRSKVKAALAYPVFVSLVGFAVIIVLLIFIVPRISGVFEDLGQRLPILTRVLIGLGQAMASFGWLAALAAIGALFLLKSYRSSPQGKLTFESLLLKAPFFGMIYRDREIARFARTLHMLLANGLPFVQALSVMEETVESPIFKGEIEDLRAGVSKGERIYERLKKSRFLPLHVINMLVVGEESGQLENSLKRIAESFERVVDRDLKLATSLLEPVTILLVGSVVGLIALAMLLPIFQINFLIR